LHLQSQQCNLKMLSTSSFRALRGPLCCRRMTTYDLTEHTNYLAIRTMPLAKDENYMGDIFGTPIMYITKIMSCNNEHDRDVCVLVA